jgi:hypothetical protein
MISYLDKTISVPDLIEELEYRKLALEADIESQGGSRKGPQPHYITENKGRVFMLKDIIDWLNDEFLLDDADDLDFSN